jgi:O-antigen/teichoic acid export membrane protein
VQSANRLAYRGDHTPLTVFDGRPAISLFDGRPVISVPDERPVISVPDERPVMSVPDERPVINVSDGRPLIRGRPAQVPPLQTSDHGSQNWAARALSALRDPVYRGSYALVANTVGTSVIGLAYWAVAAHLFSPEALGRAAALISALMLVATLSQLNLSSTLIRFLPQMGAPSASRLIKLSYLVTSLTAVAGSVIFVAVLPRLSSEWHFIGDSDFFAVIFAVSVVAWEIFTLQDAALVGLQRAGAVPVENVVYSLAKLALLIVTVHLLGSTNILFSWIVPLIFLIPVINWLMFRRCLKDRSPHDMVPQLRLRHLARFASVDYAGMICGQITANALPLLVISVLGPAAAGSFYIASLITSAVAGVGVNFSTGLLIEAAAAPERLPELTRGALKRCAIVIGPATIVLVFGARIILKIYGGSYAAQTVVLFQLLALSLLPFCILTFAFSLDRIAGKPIRTTLSQFASSILTLGGSWLLFARLGLNAVGIAWLGADIALALVRLPTILAVLRRRPSVITQPTTVPRFHAPDQSPRPSRSHIYAGRHRATGPGGAAPEAADRDQQAPRTAAPAPEAAQVPADPRAPGPAQRRSQAGADHLEGVRVPGRVPSGGDIPPDATDPGGGGPQARRRYLKSQCPEGVRVGKPFSLLASIVLVAGPHSAELEAFDVPAEGRDVLLVIYAPGLQLLSDQQQIVHVPADGDSKPARFELRADTPGPRAMSITAWIGGTYLGELVIEITAERDRMPGPHREVLAEVTTESIEGAVSLVVRYDPHQNAYRFEFRDEDYPEEVVSNLAYAPGPLVEHLIADLDNLAKGRSGYSAAQTRDYLVNAGARLWRQLLPEQLREQFWDRQHRIRQLTILADKDAVPWELLYPMDSGRAAGFLVEQFPVTRAIFGWRPARTLRLRPARFVLPEGSLPEALDEIDAMRQLLDPGQSTGDVISALTPLTDLISSGSFGLLHFACHNTYDPVGGSSIKLGSVQFTPTLLEVAAIQKALNHSAPTIFINACRSAGLNATYNQVDGWASKFLEAGAAAFIGSLWAVSDGAAREFAQELYAKLQAGSPLGEAVMNARHVAASQLDDPTWLAYAAYGNPRATVSQSPW